ncbi:COX15/CtaA family protein [Motilimonas eburnea]|uniref:COX15/CtaA family protein n=1 Tax=Motilimonas eburnea TaxID=1737488 RepID=UPI001E28BF2D|nr:COX15/CtaA family protein [Motilimonas eburnea]MCE2572344.1 COX15/CtaA family protein [Motilimonas eburnea]
MTSIKLKVMAVVALVLAVLVVGMGAYTRLTEAGLGCPDWPGCYGHHSVPTSEAEIAKATAAFPDVPLEPHKAWNEMIHRYLAGSLGLLILALAVQAVRQRRERILCISLVLVVIFQAALGMWTVTLNLMPLVVMGHLLGGFLVLALLWLLVLKQWDVSSPNISVTPRLTVLVWSGLMVLVAQIALGGWTSANYAAVVCTQLPLCEGNWWQNYNVSAALHVPPAETYQYGVLDYGARTTIHVTHRLGAVVTACFLLLLALSWWRSSQDGLSKGLAVALVLALCTQIGLGISNVVLQLPIAIAVGHSLVAASLVLILVALLWRLLQAKAVLVNKPTCVSTLTGSPVLSGGQHG